jgi:hypothetical protein
MYNPEAISVPNKKEILREHFLRESSEEVRKALNTYLGNAVDSGQFSDIQEYTLGDGKIVTVDFGLRNAKFLDDPKGLPIVVQVEDGSESWETNWDELNYNIKEKILEKI